MSATRDLIAAALTAAGSIRWQYPELADDMRELCARAMVEPDIGEVKNLVSAACNLMFDAGKLLGRRDAGADREVEDARSARTALLDYVRGVMTERDALLADNERLSGLYEQAVKGRADMRSALRDARAAAPQPVSAAEVPMPDAIGRLYFGGVSCGERDEWEFDADQGVCDGINESATEESRQRVYLHRDVLTYGVQCRAAGYAAGVAAAQTLQSLRELAAEADAALHKEVKP